MITSMTGFASLTREDELATIGVTVRSVNHRYLDVQVRAPQALAAFEQEVRSRVQRRVARGRVELTVTLAAKALPAVDVEINAALVTALVQAAERPEVAGAVGGGWTAGELLRFPQVVTLRERPSDPEVDRRVGEAALAAVDEALEALDRMRTREGEFLRADLDGRRAALADLVTRITAEAAAGQAALRERLSERVAEVSTEVAGSEAAVAQEIVRWAGRSDVHEEVARLAGHLAHWSTLAAAPEPCGRKLDFLLQEMNREVNTIGSKADGLDVSALVVEAKAELEKLREQTQNVE